MLDAKTRKKIELVNFLITRSPISQISTQEEIDNFREHVVTVMEYNFDNINKVNKTLTSVDYGKQI